MNYIHTVLLIFLTSLVGASSCTSVSPGSHPEHGDGIGLARNILAAGEALPGIEAPDVVYVGEVHNQFAYHLNQLAVIAALRERGLDVAIGMEMIQTPFQKPLDQYISGDIDFETMLAQAEYFDRWRYDARHYEPIFSYARQYRLPIIALNAPGELTDRVSELGISGLGPEDRSMLPETLTPLAPEYRSLLEQVFREHIESGSDSDLDNFIDVQKTWDEVMGAKSVEFLRKNPGSVLVVLAGMRHVAHGHGIPARVENATGLSGTIVLTENERPHMPDGGDIYLATTSETLPENGRMGVYINDTDAGAIIAGFVDDSPAEEAGAEAEDIIVRINGRTVDAFGDIKLELWDQLPGDAVIMVVRRGTEANLEEISFELY